MAKVNWTPAQRRAIDSRGNVLVSAAAGSGKTATLSAKIMKLLEDDEVTLDRFLIVTFTNAAAAELKERISREITNAATTDKKMLRHKRDVAGADICTIHSFCLKLLRRYFTTLGISPDFGVADETTAEVLKASAMETTVDDFFRGDERITAEGACDVYTLADTVGKTKDAAGLDAQLRDLSDRLDALGCDETYLIKCADSLDECAGGEFFSSPAGCSLKNELLSAATHYRSVLSELREEMLESEAVTKKYVPTADGLLEYLDGIMRSADTYADAASAVASLELIPLGRLTAKEKTDASEQFKALRDEIKKVFTRLADRYFSATAEETVDSMVRTAAVLRGAADVLAVYRKRYTALKRDRGVLDFSDLETLALKLLVNADGSPTPEALEAGSRYSFVFIDEYQDTNSVQDRIFRAVSTTAEKFFVGDIKQSIYRFSGAEPEVFSGYRRAWSEDESDVRVTDGYPLGHSIFMSENFRCAAPVIEFANAVSRYMFPHGGIPFSESDCLVYGGVAKGDVPVEVCLLDGTRTADAQGDEHAVTEAEYAADRVYSLIKDEGYAPEDIAVLLRSANTSGGLYEEAMSARGIPVKRQGGSSFADEPEVMLVLDVLRAVDNPMRDIPLAGAMMSSVFGFTMDDLAVIRHSDKDCPLYTSVVRYSDRDTPLGKRCRDFCDKLTALRSAERGMSADRFIEHLYAECSLFHCNEVTDRLYGEANLHMLHELARSYETGVFGGLYGFLAFIDEKLSSDTLKSEGKNDAGGVTVISIHKSKGLEYKVCLICECGKERNESDERSRILFDKELGIGLRLPDPGGLILCGNPVRDGVGLKMRRDGAMEEMRVLYVAMTRAKERLIVTAKCSRPPEEELSRAGERAKHADTYAVLSSKRMIDHVLGGVLTSASEAATLTLVPKNYAVGDSSLTAAGKSGETDALTEKELAEIKKAVTYVYPHAHLKDIPSKLSVSALYPTVLDGDETVPYVLGEASDETSYADVPDTELSTEELPAATESISPDDADTATNDEAVTVSSAMPKPRFMTGGVDTSPTERGTSTHVFLQFADFAALRDGGIRGELDRLKRDRFITPRMAELVNRAQVEHFAKSTIMERILSARRVYRELRFNLLLPASSFTSDEELKQQLRADGNTITVQGVFDCVFEDSDGRLVLLDYKTDYMTYEERQTPELGRRKLLDRHSRQLSYYAEAATRLFGRAPDEVYVYSLALGEAVSVNERLSI